MTTETRLFLDGYYTTHGDVMRECQRLVDDGWTIVAVLPPSRNDSLFSIVASHPTLAHPSWETDDEHDVAWEPRANEPWESWPDNMPLDEQLQRLAAVLSHAYPHTFDRSEGAMEKASRLLWERAFPPPHAAES